MAIFAAEMLQAVPVQSMDMAIIARYLETRDYRILINGLGLNPSIEHRVYAVYRANPSGAYDRDDVRQEMYLCLDRAARSYDPTKCDKFIGYFARCADNVVAELLGRNRVTKTDQVAYASLDEYLEDAHESEDGNSGSDRFLKDEKSLEGFSDVEIMDAIQCLPEKMQELCLRLASGEKEASIARSWGCKRANISYWKGKVADKLSYLLV